MRRWHWFPLTLSSLCALAPPWRCPPFIQHLSAFFFPHRRRTLHLQTNDDDAWGVESVSCLHFFWRRRTEKTSVGQKVGWEGRRGSDKEEDRGEAAERLGRNQRKEGGRDVGGGVIIYQVFGCAWQRRKLISTLCVHQLQRQPSQGIPTWVSVSVCVIYG